MAPSHIKGGHWDHNRPILFFSLGCVKAQTFVELEGIMGIEVKAEEEPEGETIVGSGGEALRPLGMDITYLFQINFLYFRCTRTAAPLVVIYIRSSSVY